MKYTLEFPAEYIKPKVQNLADICKALRSGAFKQGSSRLLFNEEDNTYTVMGIISRMQGRIVKLSTFWQDGNTGRNGEPDEKHENGATDCLCLNNPLFSVLNRTGYFPTGVVLRDGSGRLGGCISGADSHGYDFNQLADMLEEIFQ